MKTKTERKTE